MLTVEVKATGKCVTRNGEYPIEAVRVELSKDGKARLGFVSSRLHRNLHAGTTIDAGAMDRLALKWAMARGLIEKDGKEWGGEVSGILAEISSLAEKGRRLAGG